MRLPKCRLFLVTPGSGDAGLLADCLSAALAAGDVASLLISDPTEIGSLRQIAERLVPLAQSGDAAVLIEDNCELANQLGADGVEIVADVSTLKASRTLLGPDMVIGADCQDDRHVAMELAEAGADYVRLSPYAPGPGDEPLIGWWSQLFEIPCVAADPLSADQISDIARLGADFIRPDDAMWTSPQMATEIVTNAMQELEAAHP